MTRRILVTSALPYANGPIHIGHLVEYIQTDIWVRFQRLRGNRCIYVCADDTHGTAIMISAQKAGVSEEDWIARVSEEHQRDFAGFDVQFDNYGSTNSPENRELCNEFWAKMQAAELVKEKSVESLFDPEANTFLADRFVRGTCPNPDCGAENQPGDNCSVCGSTYSPAELIDPKSTLSGATPELRSSPHAFIQLEKLHDFLEDWVEKGGHLQPEVVNYLQGHFLGDSKTERKELRDLGTSAVRPPYFGFEIPNRPGDYWYVWFDAPIGYLASTRQWCDRKGEDFDLWWRDQETEIHHFIGKDITYFHTLFWPGMLKTAGFNLPQRVQIHGFLTVNKRKMSKSDGTFIRAETYLKYLNPSYLRYFYASKLGARLDDIDLDLEEFEKKVNADLVGKVVNLAARTAKFVSETGLSQSYPDDDGLFEYGAKQGEAIAEAYEGCDYNRAMRLILELADRANPFVENAAPWTLRKDPEQAQRLQDVCTIALNLFRQIVIYLSPVLPRLAEQTGQLFNQPIQNWDEAQQPLTGIAIAKFQHMLQRVNPKDVEKMIEESKDEVPADAAENTATGDGFNDSAEPLQEEPLADQITIDEFVKVDLRVARVIQAEQVAEARKLLKLTLSLGGEEQRTVFAGIKQAYDPEKLVGRLVVVVANLAPRQMKFGLSEGMVVAAGPGGKEVFLLNVDEGAQPGQRLH